MIKTVGMPMCYKDFHCIATKCTDTCCAGWQVDVDAQSWEYYKTVSGEFGDYMHSVMREFEPIGDEDAFADKGQFVLRSDGRCPFLNDTGLCDMFTALGEEKLCKTCTNYPRFMEDYGTLREVGIAFSCPEAARLMLADDKPMAFAFVDCENQTVTVNENRMNENIAELLKTNKNLEVSAAPLFCNTKKIENDELLAAADDILARTKGMGVSDCEELCNEQEETLEQGFKIETEDFDEGYFKLLLESRKTAWKIAQERKLPIEKRAALLLDYAVAVQRVIDVEEEFFDLADELQHMQEKVSHIQEQYSDASWVSRRLEVLSEQVQNYSEDADGRRLYDETLDIGQLRYHLLPEYAAVIYQDLKHCKPQWGPMLDEAEEVLHKQMDAKAYQEAYKEFECQNQEKDYQYEHLLSYFIFKYYLKSYFDDDVYGKVQLSIMGYLMVKELGVCQWMKQNKQYTTQDQAELFHLYSREMEHSDENYEMFRDSLKMENMCNYEHLLGVLLECE